MGERGPAKTPTHILKLRGSWRADAREGEPTPDRSRPRCPIWLAKEAKRAWRELVPQLEHMGLLAKCDRNAIVRYCQTLAMWREAQEWLMEHGTVHPEKDAAGRVVGLREYPHVARVIRLSEVLARLEKQFGLTPAARANLAVAKPEKPEENRGRERFFQKSLGRA